MKKTLCVFLTLVVFFQFYWMDGIFGLLGEIAIGKTVYSKKYSEWNFSKIRIGMSEDELLQMMGEPVRILIFEDEKSKTFKYTDWAVSNLKGPGPNYLDGSGPDCNYTVRNIRCKDGRVIEIDHEFWVD